MKNKIIIKILFLVLLMTTFTYQVYAACSVQNAFSTGQGTRPSSILFNPNINFAYVMLSGTNQILPYSYNQKTGQLKRLYGYEVDSGGVNPGFGATISPNGKTLYVVNNNSNTVAVFAINQSSGALTKLQVINTPYSLPFIFNISPNGKYAYVDAYNSNELAMYNINPINGTLSPLISAQNNNGYVTTPASPFCCSFSPSGKYVYLTSNAENRIVRYKYNDQTGDLSIDNNWQINQGLGQPFGVLFDPSNTHALIPSTMLNQITLYNYDLTTDNLIPNLKQNSISTGVLPFTFMQWYVNNQFTYMGDNGDNTLAEYRYFSDGTMQLIGKYPTLAQPSVVRQPSDTNNNHLFVVSGLENCIADYSIDNNSGLLLPRNVNTDVNVNAY